MSHMKRYLHLSSDLGRYPSLSEWRAIENARSNDVRELASFADYLAIAQKSLETFNRDTLYEDINQLQ